METGVENTVELVEGQLGSVGSYDLEFQDGNLTVSLKADVGPLKAGLTLVLDSAQLMDAVAKAIPGTVDDAVIGVIKAALLKK